MEGVALIDSVLLCPPSPLLKRSDSQTVSPRRTVEHCLWNWNEQTQRSIRSFKPHVHFNDRLSAHSVLTSQAILSQRSLLRRYINIMCVNILVKKMNPYSHVDLTTNQSTVFLRVGFTNNYSSISQQALTFTETRWSSYIHLSFYDHFFFLFSQRSVVHLYRL